MTETYFYICQPNPSGKGEFAIQSSLPIRAGELIVYEGKRYEVLQVQYWFGRMSNAIASTQSNKLIVNLVRTAQASKLIVRPTREKK